MMGGIGATYFARDRHDPTNDSRIVTIDQRSISKNEARTKFESAKNRPALFHSRTKEISTTHDIKQPIAIGIQFVRLFGAVVNGIMVGRRTANEKTKKEM